jgi:hypothetical protein
LLRTVWRIREPQPGGAAGSGNSIPTALQRTIRTLRSSKVEKMEETKKMEFSLARVVTWTLVFTNAYFLLMLVSRLF